MTEPLFDSDKLFRLADDLIERPLDWSRSVPAPSSTPVLSFVKFRAFDRALEQYRSIIQLLRAGQWEDAVILARSLYELNLNLSEIERSPDRELAAKEFVRFGRFQQLRLEQRRLEDRVKDGKSQPTASPQRVIDYEQKLAEIASKLDRDFADFRDPKTNKWQESWAGVSVEKLAQRVAKDTGGQRGESDYFVFKLGSLFTHNTPASLFLTLRGAPETAKWTEFRDSTAEAGRTGLAEILHEASVCLVDIIGIAGECITGYERQWFDRTALPLLDSL